MSGTASSTRNRRSRCSWPADLAPATHRRPARDMPSTPSTSSLNIPALLARTPLFQGLSATELANVAGGTRELTYDRGEVLFRRGDPSDGFFFLIYGQIKLSFISPQGGEKVVELISPNQTFGEAVMFMGKP